MEQERHQGRLWTLYERHGDRWIRCTPLAYPVKQARKVFEPNLLQGVFGGPRFSLRPIPKAEMLRHKASIAAEMERPC